MSRCNLDNHNHLCNLTQPSFGLPNVASGTDYLIRNERTDGAWVAQAKRFAFNLGVSPTFFGFYPGFAGFQRVRHSFSTIINYSLAPSAEVPADLAAAAAAQGSTIQLTSPRVQRLTVGLSQNFEGKRLNPAATDSTAPDASRKQRVLSIVTSPVGYDFEQAKEPGRTGWTTQLLTNSFQSDLLPGW